DRRLNRGQTRRSMSEQWVEAHGRRFVVETLDTNIKPAPRKSRPKRFTKVPEIWRDVLSKARVSGCTYAVAPVLPYEPLKRASLGHKPVFNFTSAMAGRANVGERGKGSALDTLERLKLISVVRQVGKNPRVTVYFFE